MPALKKYWKNIVYIAILLILFCLLMQWYNAENRKMIQEQSLNYALDSNRLSSIHVRDEFNGAMRQIRSHAFFMEENISDSPNIASVLRKIEKSSSFDAIRFTKSDGTTYAASGASSEASDISYYHDGFNGQNGICVIYKPEDDQETMINFYTPVRYQGRIIGVLRGLYFAEKYLQKMLFASYFDEAAYVFLCDEDEMSIASSDDTPCDRPIMEILSERASIDSRTDEGIKNIFLQGEGEKGFICGSGSNYDILCVTHISGSNYVLVQVFPRSVTQGMIRSANRTGIMFQFAVIAIFALFVLLFGLHILRAKKQLEHDNADMGCITDAVNTMFKRFVHVDLGQDTYRFLAGSRPVQSNFPAYGNYADFIHYIGSFLVYEKDRKVLKGMLSYDTLVKNFGEHKYRLQYEYPVLFDGQLRWFHLNIICMERHGTRADKLVFLWYDATSLKEKEQRIEAQLSFANRRGKHYITATLTDAFCSYEVNMTSQKVESVNTANYSKLIQTVAGQEFAERLKSASAKVPINVSDW